MWENLGDELGRDTVNLLWQLSMFASFAIGVSGTESTRWKNVGYAFFAIFVIALFLRIVPG
jgi:hypothetical protein